MGAPHMTQEPRRELVGRPHEVQFTDFVEIFPSTLPSRASISKIFASISSSVSPVRSRINSHIAWHASVSLSTCRRTSAISAAYRSAFDNALSAVCSAPAIFVCWYTSQIIFLLDNVQSRAPLSEAAHIYQGVDVKAKEDHVIRTAHRSCCVSGSSASSVLFWRKRLGVIPAEVATDLIIGRLPCVSSCRSHQAQSENL